MKIKQFNFLSKSLSVERNFRTQHGETNQIWEYALLFHLLILGENINLLKLSPYLGVYNGRLLDSSFKNVYDVCVLPSGY